MKRQAEENVDNGQQKSLAGEGDPVLNSNSGTSSIGGSDGGTAQSSASTGHPGTGDGSHPGTGDGASTSTSITASSNDVSAVITVVMTRMT